MIMKNYGKIANIKLKLHNCQLEEQSYIFEISNKEL